MKHLTLSCILFLIILSVNAQSKCIRQNAKNKFDIQKPNENPDGPEVSTKSLNEWLVGCDNVWQNTILNGGYFTIGTSSGISESNIDDECSLTFGHPFAMSSYAFPIINNYQYSPLELLINQTGVICKNADSLSYTVVVEDICEATFLLVMHNDNLMEMKYSLKNNSDEEQSFGMGLMYDAANGTGDDGNLIYNNNFINNYTQITDLMQDSLVFWERKQAPKGIGFCLHYSDNIPDEVTIGNWQNLYYDDEIINDLFDLAVLQNWNSELVQPNENIEFVINFELLYPDYSGQAFLRWDMPSALSLENQMLFPMEINTIAQIVTDNNSLQGLSLYTPENFNIFEIASESEFNLNNSDSCLYESFKMELCEIYDSAVVEVELFLMQGETIVDRLVQNVFIPASPFSNEGLIVDADSVFLHNDSIVVRFNTIKEETGQYIYNLNKPNIYFWEEQTRIEDYKLSKDTTGGTNNADIVFVIDVSGSMGDNINQVKNNIVEFGDSLSANGINFRLGLIGYEVTPDPIYDFTTNTLEFWNYLNQMYVHGGTENALLALMTAADFDFRADATRTIILLTDEDIDDENNPFSVQDVADELLSKAIIMHCISLEELYPVYEQLILNTGGAFFNINGNFRDILMEIAQTDANPSYLVSYMPAAPISVITNYTIENHYAGLGGSDDITYDPNVSKSEIVPNISIYPNPITSNTFNLDIDDINAEYCYVEIFDLHGTSLYKDRMDVVEGTVTMDFDYIGRASCSILVLKLIVYDNQNNSYIKSISLINN